MALELFGEPVRDWFAETFDAPTTAQTRGWPPIARGDDTLILAPTGSGKTLSAFLWAIDRLIADPTPDGDPHTRVVYVSPLRALAVDVDRNLKAPLAGITAAARRGGRVTAMPTVAVRTGDTSAAERRRIARNPPDILITTPESLYLMMTSQARQTLTRAEVVIIDEIHSVAGTKRGAHLALTLERLAGRAASPPQRIGLSATMAPAEVGARFLGGRGGDDWRPVTIVDAGAARRLEAEVIVPVEDMARTGRHSVDPRRGNRPGTAAAGIWPSIHPRLLDLVEAHESTLIFVNSRRLAERLADKLNELIDERCGRGDYEPPTVRAHHGSISRQVRTELEDALKAGTLSAIVATSSLELGIDMGAVDLVLQVESPGSVGRGLQRIGRAGHQVGAVSKGKIFPKHRADLLEATVVADRMRAGQIEPTRLVSNPLDVLAQQIVAMTALDDWPLDELAELVRGAANFADLTDAALRATLDMLAGRYPSDRFAELRPRVVWDRLDDVVSGRRGSQRLAVTNPGTIPDRGLFGVFLSDGTRVGELDEEMVHESRPGDTFILGASTWRIEQITFDRVVVGPAPGAGGRMPFWRGDGPGRPVELGRAIGRFTRELAERRDRAGWLSAELELNDLAAKNLVAFLDDQQRATGAVPDDRTVVVERFRDELGDWRLCIHTPFGAQIHAPWATALRARLRAMLDAEVEILHSDDGIVVRLPEHVESVDADLVVFDPDEVGAIVVAELPATAMFASRFREAAGRALLLPRRRPGRRTPLWQQRQRSADLLEAAAGDPEFPIVLETLRECMNDVFDIDGLVELFGSIASGEVRVVVADTQRASPFAQSLLFDWVSVFMYEGDAPRAERRAAALNIDHGLLAELLGREELRELLAPDVIDETAHELVHARRGAVRDADDLQDLLRMLGPRSPAELAAAGAIAPAQAGAWLDELIAARRAFEVEVTGRPQVAAVEDAARLRDGLGVEVPSDLPAAFLESVDAASALDDLVARFARTHGPFTAAAAAEDLGADLDSVQAALERLEAADRVIVGEFLPGGTTPEWCDRAVLARIRRRSLAALREQIRPVDPESLGRFLPAWQGVGSRRQGFDGLIEAISPLQGAKIPASVLESDVLAVRMAAYRAADLDALAAAGHLVWVGAGSIGTNDGWIRLVFRDQLDVLTPPEPDGCADDDDPAVAAIRGHLAERGASFWTEIVRACADAGADYDDDSVLGALWQLVWAGEVTNDTLAPLRALVAARPGRPKSRGRRRPAPGALRPGGPPTGAGRWTLVRSPADPPIDPTRHQHAQTMQLLHRYGVLSRDAASFEGISGGFSAIYDVLSGLEARGRVRRGYFVETLGAAQFALPGAVDRLRRPGPALAGRPGSEAVVLAATDPAQPFGALLPWPESTGRPTRRAGAHVVIEAGQATAYLNRGGDDLTTFGDSASSAGWAQALADAADTGRLRPMIAAIDGVAAPDSPLSAILESAGFTRSYRGWTRPST